VEELQPQDFGKKAPYSGFTAPNSAVSMYFEDYTSRSSIILFRTVCRWAYLPIGPSSFADRVVERSII
jgi:hypothetical protein